MSQSKPLPPVNATTIALNNSAPGTTELFGNVLLGFGVAIATIFVGGAIYNKLKQPNNTASVSASESESTPATSGAGRRRHTRCVKKVKNNSTRKTKA